MSQFQPEPTWEFVSKANRHHCDIPKVQHRAATFVVGDVIKCRVCQKDYILIKFDYGSQREPYNPPRLDWNLTSYSQGQP